MKTTEFEWSPRPETNIHAVPRYTRTAEYEPDTPVRNPKTENCKWKGRWWFLAYVPEALWRPT